MPAAFTASRQIGASRRTTSENSAGVLPSGSTPILRRRSAVAGGGPGPRHYCGGGPAGGRGGGAVDDWLRRAGRREVAVPGAGGEAGIGLGNRGNVRKLRRALGARDAEHADVAALRMLDQLGGVAEVHLHLAAYQIGDCLRAALVRDVRHIEPGARQEERGGEMRDRARARRGEIELPRARLHIIDEFLHCGRRHRNVRAKDERIGADDRDRREVLEGIEVHFLHERQRELRRGSEKKRVAVRRALRDELGGDGAASADLVLDHERLAEERVQALGDDARLGVGVAAGDEGHDHLDRLLRPGLRLSHRKRRERADEEEVVEAHQIIAEPPSTTMVWPVMKAASSLARKLTAPTRSSGFSSRAMARVRRVTSPWRTCCSCFATFSESLKPGASAFTVMPSPPSSRARPRVMAITAPLLAM